MTDLENSGKEISPPGPLIEATDFTDFRMNTNLYTRLFDLDVFGHKAPFFLWDGKLVEKEELPGGDGFRPYRIGLERYQKMIAAGVFAEYEPVGLWQGRLVKPMQADATQGFITSLLPEWLIEVTPPAWVVVARRPVVINEWSLPEPDLAVIRGSLRDYQERYPNSLDLGLLIEVADQTLAIDRRIKLRPYAHSRLPWYGIVNIPDRRMEVYEQPVNLADGPGYALCRDYRPGQSVPVILEGETVGRIALDEIFPT